MAVARSISSWRMPLAIASAIIVVDQLTKHWAVTGLGDDRVIDVFWTLRFNLAFNTGMAFSRGTSLGPLIAVVATVVIVWLLVSLKTQTGRLSTFGIGSVIGGAAGNLIDRAFRNDAWLRGGVVDFIDFQWFPIFNVADIAINVGAGALLLSTFRLARAERRAERAAAFGDDAVPSDSDPADVVVDAADPDVDPGDPIIDSVADVEVDR